MKKTLLLVALLCSLLLAGCTAADPLTDNLYSNASYIRVGAGGDAGYWHEYNMSAFSASPGMSGSTLIATNASSLGGYQLNAIGEYLYFTTHVENDWDGVSNGLIEIWFEVNDDNSGGLVTDTVDFSLEVYHKLVTEQTNTVISLGGSTVVGQSQQHDLFKQDIIITNLRLNEVISFRINLNTIISEVDDIIINYVEFKYPVFVPALER